MACHAILHIRHVHIVLRGARRSGIPKYQFLNINFSMVDFSRRLARRPATPSSRRGEKRAWYKKEAPSLNEVAAKGYEAASHVRFYISRLYARQRNISEIDYRERERDTHLG